MHAALDGLLIPEPLLIPLHGEARVAGVDLSVTEQGGDEPALLHYLVLTCLPERVPSPWQESHVILHNRYYWLRRYAHERQQQHGPDAGLEQMVYQLLEANMPEVDWAVIEQIEACLS